MLWITFYQFYEIRIRFTLKKYLQERLVSKPLMFPSFNSELNCETKGTFFTGKGMEKKERKMKKIYDG